MTTEKVTHSKACLRQHSLVRISSVPARLFPSFPCGPMLSPGGRLTTPAAPPELVSSVIPITESFQSGAPSTNHSGIGKKNKCLDTEVFVFHTSTMT